MSQCKLDDRPGEKIRRSRDTPVGIVPGRELPLVISAPAFDGSIVKDRTGVLTSRDDGHRPRALREAREDHAKKKPEERRIRHRLAECTTTSGITRRVRSLPGPHCAASGSPRARFATIECPTCERARRYARRKPLFSLHCSHQSKRRRAGKTGARQAPSQQNSWLGANTSISIIANRHALPLFRARSFWKLVEVPRRGICRARRWHAPLAPRPSWPRASGPGATPLASSTLHLSGADARLRAGLASPRRSPAPPLATPKPPRRMRTSWRRRHLPR